MNSTGSRTVVSLIYKSKQPVWRCSLRARLNGLVLSALLVSLGACGSMPVQAPENTTPATVIDFRQPSLRSAATTLEFADALAVKEAVYGTGFPDTLHVGEPIVGSFTSVGELQSAYLLTRSDSRNAMLAVFSVAKAGDSSTISIGSILGQLVLDEPYQRLLAAQDINNDALDELVLLQDDFHMGALVQTIDMLSIADMQASLIRQEPFVMQDNCASELDDRSIRASRLQFYSDAIVRDEFIADCVDVGVEGSVQVELVFVPVE